MSAPLRGAVLAAFLCAAWQGPGASTLPMFVVTDLHYLTPELHDDGPAFRSMVMNGDGKDTMHCDAILDALAYELPKPSILLVTGDLTLNGEEASHRALARRFESLGRAGVRVYVLPGNHDLDNPWAAEYRGSSRRRVASVSAARFREIYEGCGYSAAASRDEESLSYSAELDAGLDVLMLDSTVHDRNASQGYPESSGRLSGPTLAWIDAKLGEARRQGRRVVVAMHHNLLDHNSMLGAGYTLDDADELLAILIRRGQRFALDGHIHIQSIAKLDSGAGPVFDIATNSLAVYPHNYGRLDSDPASGGFSYSTSRLDVAAWAKAKRLRDPYLENFAESSSEYFGGFARRLVDKFGLTDDLTKGELALLLDFMARLNRDFFAGAIDGARRRELLASPGHDAVGKLRGSFLADYVESLLEPAAVDSNRLSIPAAGPRG